MFYVVIARDRPDNGALRDELSSRHLQYLKSLGSKVLFAGATFDDHGAKSGSMMALEAPSLDDAKSMAAADPFVTEGLYASLEVMRWSFGVDNVSDRNR